MNIQTLNQFASYAWGTLVHPNATFEKLLAEAKPIAYGGFSILLVGALYTLTTGIGYMNGFGAYTIPFLPVSPEDYYFYQIFFTIIVFGLCALIFAAVVQFFSVFVGGKGTFENVVAVAGFSLYMTIVPFMWIPETIMFVGNLHSPLSPLIGTIGLHPALDLFGRQGGTVLWQLIVTIIGVKKVQQYSWLKAMVIGLVGMIFYEVIFWTYIR